MCDLRDAVEDDHDASAGVQKAAGLGRGLGGGADEVHRLALRDHDGLVVLCDLALDGWKKGREKHVFSFDLFEFFHFFAAK